MSTVQGSYSADYGNLRLEVYPSGQEQGTFEYRVFDKSDGATVWAGAAPNLDAAQSSALFEAQTFVNDPHPPAPSWSLENPAAQI